MFHIADAHCDTLSKIALENILPRDCAVTRERLERGGVSLQTFALFIGGAADEKTYYERAKKMICAAPRLGIPLITGPLPDVLPETPHGIFSIEGCEFFGGKLERFHEFADQGIKLCALTWNYENELGYPASGGDTRGLKPFGRALIAEMDARGVLCDVSHLNDAGFEDVLNLSRLPVVASHSNLRALCAMPRNLATWQARALIERRGFIGVNFYAGFLNRNAPATVDDVLRVIDTLCAMGGEDVVGFGSDFDGIDRWPEHLAHPGDLSGLLDLLARHGYTNAQLAKIAGENFLRVLKEGAKGI